jgi:hypothetical protein
MAVLCRGLKRTAWSEHGMGAAWQMWIRHGRSVLIKWERHIQNPQRHGMGAACYVWIGFKKVAKCKTVMRRWGCCCGRLVAELPFCSSAVVHRNVYEDAFWLKTLWRRGEQSCSPIRNCTPFVGPEYTELILPLVNEQLDARFIFLICLFQFSTCFKQPRAHHQENQLYQYNIWYMSLCVGDRLECRSGRTCTPDTMVI